MRDYTYLDSYINALAVDICPQPPDPGHQAAIENLAKKWLPRIAELKRQDILDVGCGQGQAIPILQRHVESVMGVTLGQDAVEATKAGYLVYQADMSFLPIDTESIDIVFARHVLEHSPMPLLTLMEWHRVAKHYLIVVVPDFQHYKNHGDNHYYVLTPSQWQNLFERAGWTPLWYDNSWILQPPFEIRWLLRKSLNEDDYILEEDTP